MKSDLISVLTPAYNSLKTLYMVIHSLEIQDYRNFEWILVDDGSNDGTKEWYETNKNKFDFKSSYYYQENAGKHNAVNFGVKIANGAFTIIADADDSFKPNTFSTFLSTWYKIDKEHRHKYAGVWCLCENEEGKVLGKPYPSDPWLAGTNEFYFTNKIVGEKWQMIRTEILRCYPLPSIKQKGIVVSESNMWGSIGIDYEYICINKALRIYCITEVGLMSSNNNRIKTSLSNEITLSNFLSKYWRYLSMHLGNFLVLLFFITLHYRILKNL